MMLLRKQNHRMHSLPSQYIYCIKLGEGACVAKKVINTKVATEEPHLHMEKTHVLTGISQLHFGPSKILHGYKTRLLKIAKHAHFAKPFTLC